MDIESLRAFCLRLPGTTEAMKWEHLCFLIEEKIFALIDLENQAYCSKCTPEEFEELTAKQGIRQAPHFAKKQWVYISHFNLLSDAQTQERFLKSRDLVLRKLPKKVQDKYRT